MSSTIILNYQNGLESWVNLAYYMFMSCWIEIFLQILVRVNFLPNPQKI